MLRLTGGEFRGRMIQTPSHDHVRPTQARLRQAWFNSIQAEIPEAKILDLFAGSGALGFEALSRGASEVTFVEKHRSTLKLIAKNVATLGVNSRVELIEASVDSVFKRVERRAPFDLVFADPPYE
ncbi:MAG: 16S rRNA (guanine(966)-N(2))-methyltransferase RsmD, partial [Bdellovibrionota bacterium]